MSNLNYNIYTLNPDDSFEEWDHFVDEAPQGSIFCRSWWLKSVCLDDFKVLLIKRDEKIIAGIPLPMARKSKSNIFTMPVLTQVLGVLMLPSKRSTYQGRLSDEMEIIGALVAAIPKYSNFSMNFHYNFSNWLPFYWAGYKQTTRYTYVIQNLTDLNKIYANFSYSKRKNIKKAEQLVKIYEDLSPEEFYANHKLTLRKQGKSISYSYQIFKRIYETTITNSAGKIWCAKDKLNNIHAATFVIYDNKSAYYLISSIDPDFRNSGAATLLIREAIKYVSKYTQRFDFEGSMIRGVENSFRLLGGIQTPYFNIYQDRRFLLFKTIDALRTQVGKTFIMFSLRNWR